MNKYCTEYYKIDSKFNEFRRYAGQYIDAISFEDAEQKAFDINPELVVTGILVSEIDYVTDERIDYDYNLN